MKKILVLLVLSVTACNKQPNTFPEYSSLSEENSALNSSNFDWNQNLQFAHTNIFSKRTTLESGSHGIQLWLHGTAFYRNTNASLQKLINGSMITLELAGGQKARLNTPAKVIIALDGKATSKKTGRNSVVTLPITVKSANGRTLASPKLTQEEAQSEFTVVSYNVENLFDQEDEPRNAHYGDYRITPNNKGFHSNYGDLVSFEGTRKSFTEVKIAGIKKTILGIDSFGPAIVALQEVESEASLAMLYEEVAHLGYRSYQFTSWPSRSTPNAIGAGIISKFPIIDWGLIDISEQQTGENAPQDNREPSRRILKVTVDVFGHHLTIYNNHWKSKGGPESKRLAAARALEREIKSQLAANPKADIIILGDLNSNYNEKATIEPRHNDTDGITGINDGIHAQGNELLTQRGVGSLKYNLHYEIKKNLRKTAWHGKYGWSSFDHIIINSGLYDCQGITYVDNSFHASSKEYPALTHLFRKDGTTLRWNSERRGQYTHHSTGGYSDHAPVFARFHVRSNQSADKLDLQEPGQPDEL